MLALIVGDGEGAYGDNVIFNTILQKISNLEIVH